MRDGARTRRAALQKEDHQVNTHCTWVAVVVLLAFGAVSAESQGWCTGDVYISTGVTGGSTMYRLEVVGSSATLTPVCSVPFLMNGHAINPASGEMFVDNQDGDTHGRMDTACNFTPIATSPALPRPGNAYLLGAHDLAGVTYYTGRNGGDSGPAIYAIDVSGVEPFPAGKNLLDMNYGSGDLAVNPIDGRMYATCDGDLCLVDLAGGTMARLGIEHSSPGLGGSLVFTETGLAYTYHNDSGTLTRIDLASGRGVIAARGPTGTNGDGSSCALPAVEEQYQLGDFVWYDTNQNGIQDVSEPGLEGVAVSVFEGDQCNIEATAEVVTDANGSWVVSSMFEGDLCIEFDGVPASWFFSPADAGDGANDSRPDSAGEYRVELLDDLVNVDAGLFANGVVGGLVFCDENRNGTQDPGEELEGVDLSLFRDLACDGTGDEVLELATTNSSGQYGFDPVPAGPPAGAALCYVTEIDESTLPADCAEVTVVPPTCELTADDAVCDEVIVVEPPVAATLLNFNVGS